MNYMSGAHGYILLDRDCDCDYDLNRHRFRLQKVNADRTRWSQKDEVSEAI